MNKNPKSSITALPNRCDYTAHVNNVSYNKWREIIIWCRASTPDFKFDFQYQGKTMDTWWTFNNANDAALFTLTWN